MAYSRKPYLLSSGEELLLSYDVITHIRRMDSFATTSGLDPEQLVNNPLCVIPIPAYGRDANGRLERFSGANVEFLTHPMMWLPDGTATPRLITDSDGVDRLEYESEWAIRVGLELTFSGLYDPADGTWLDVLALHNLDIENPVDYARVDAWLDGGADPILDNIDLTEFVTVDGDADWSVHSTQNLHDVLVAAQWSLLAESLEQALVRECAHSVGDEQRQLATIIVELAIDTLSNTPTSPDSGVAIADALLSVLDQLEDPESNVNDALNLTRTFLLDEKERYEFAVALARPATD